VDVFKNVSITGDDDIPLNKRGGGVKRLILLNFFRAEAERKKEATHNGVIFAIEEPETSQHSDNQRLLIEAFKEISTKAGNQVIITTHSPVVVKSLDMDSIRIVLEQDDHSKGVHPADSSVLQYLSLNEVSYIAFGEVTEEYHDELYGFIEHQKWKAEFFRTQTETNRPYRKYGNQRDLTIITQDLCLSEYVRHQIHHSDNDLNDRYTREDLVNSIVRMRDFIRTKQGTEREWMY
jgi:ribonuclease HI